MTCRALAKDVETYSLQFTLQNLLTDMKKHIIKELAKSRWSIYLLLTLCLFLSITYLQSEIQVAYDKTLAVQLWRTIDSLLLASPILFFKRKSILFTWLFLICFYLLSIIWYYRTYATIMPLTSYLLFQNLKGLSSSIMYSMHATDIFIVLPILFFSGIYVFISRVPFKRIAYHKLLILYGIITITAIFPYLQTTKETSARPIHLYTTLCSRAFKEYGIIHFWIYQISLNNRPVAQKDIQYINAYLKKIKKDRYKTYNDSTSAHHKNLVIILVESLQTWPIGLKADKYNIAPCLDSLTKLPQTIYIPQVLSQVKDGRSSDAQLLINTGLLPLNSGAASNLCTENLFYSLPKALREKGFHSYTFINEEKEFWNQKRMSAAYGFDDIYDRLWDGIQKRADSLLFQKSLTRLKDFSQPFYAQIVTLSMHFPYNEVHDPDSPLLNCAFTNEEVRNYLIAVNLFDKRLANFLQGLKKAGLYDNSIIVITGDHEQMTYNQYEGRKEMEASDCFVPLIILNSPLHCKHQDKVIGQVDIYPSLLYLMGCNNYDFNGLGENIFGDSISNYATFRTGIAAGDNHIPESVKQQRNELWHISDILLRMDYFACDKE